MSSSSKRQLPTTRPAGLNRSWLWLAVGGIAVILIGVFLLFSTSNGYVPTVTGEPQISVEQTHFDYGSVQYGTQVETVVRVRNTGDQPLIISGEPRVQVVEGCCPPEAVVSSYGIRPGQEATITVKFTMHEGMGGPHDFRLHINTNDPDEPVQTITILSDWVA